MNSLKQYGQELSGISSFFSSSGGLNGTKFWFGPERFACILGITGCIDYGIGGMLFATGLGCEI